MRISKSSRQDRFYVAVSETEAFSSWDTQIDAQSSWDRLKIHQPHDAEMVKGILKVSTTTIKTWIPCLLSRD
jgi:uncharacterized protein YbdZ (MbtH family)